jgi:hypothetical protein
MNLNFIHISLILQIAWIIAIVVWMAVEFKSNDYKYYVTIIGGSIFILTNIYILRYGSLILVY